MVTFTSEELMTLTPEELEELKAKREAELRERWEKADCGGGAFAELYEHMMIKPASYSPPTVADLHAEARRNRL